MGRPRRALTEEALHKEPAPLTRVLIVLLCGVGHAVNQLAGAIAGSVNVCRIVEIMNEEKRMRRRKGAGEKEGMGVDFIHPTNAWKYYHVPGNRKGMHW